MIPISGLLFPVSGFSFLLFLPPRSPRLRVSPLLLLRMLPRYSASLRLPTLGYTFVFPLGYVLSHGGSLPVDFATLHPAGCLAAGYPASTRWHVFRSPAHYSFVGMEGFHLAQSAWGSG